MIQQRPSRAITALTVVACLTIHHWTPSAGAQHQGHKAADGVASLDVYADGATIHRLTAEVSQEPARTILLYAQSVDGARTWSEPVRVDAGAAAPYARGRGTDFHVAAHGSHRVALWMTRGTGFGGRGPLVTARSGDGGKTWTPGPNPADDQSDSDHAFMDIIADARGHFHAVWLDNREGEGKGLRLATSEDHGVSWSTNRSIDDATCECCWNVLQADDQGVLYALYRNIDPRDMSLALSRDGGKSWRDVGVVGTFDWNFDGCPHVGGGLAIDQSGPVPRYHAVVWTGKKEQLGTYYLAAMGDEFSWSAPVRIGNKDAKFADLAVTVKGRVGIAWDQPDGGDSAIFCTVSSDRGATWSMPRRLSLPGRDATHARMVRIGEDLHAFWTETVNGQTTVQHSIF